jgi:hypothetical protein
VFEFKSQYHQKKALKIELPYDPTIPLLIRLQQRHLNAHVYYSTVHDSQTMKTANMPYIYAIYIMDIENMVFVYHRILFSHKEVQNIVICR